nr:sigma-70 family RNA polymerase sigma factor [Terriglobus roseus]
MRSGDRTAFDELLRRYIRLMRRTAFGILKNIDDAEDAVQEASIRAYIKIDTFEGTAAFSTWLTRIVINQSLMHLRQKKARPVSSLDELMGPEGSSSLTVADPSATPERLCVDASEKERLRTAMRQLPKTFRDVVHDHFREELPISVLAKKRGLTMTAAKSRLFRARHHLMTALREPSVSLNATASNG